MRNDRNAYLVSKAMRSFVLASSLTAAAGQLAATLDAIVLAQFIGEEAVSALSIVLPVTTFISCLGLLMAFGANALGAKAIGRQDLNAASAVFSTAVWSILIVGGLFSLLIFALLPDIVRLIAEPELRELPLEYLRYYSLGAWMEMLSYALCLFVASDGHPRRVTFAVFVGVFVNFAIDVLAVGFFEWGIRGVAIGTLAQFAVNVVLLSFYLRDASCSYRFRWPGGKGLKLLVHNVEEGLPVTISNILMATTVFFFNMIIYNALGDRGLFFWSVCLQMLLVAVVFINGVMEAIFAIGGVMVGEHDVKGFRLLAHKSLLTVTLLVVGLMVLMWIPDVVGVMFGVEDVEEMASLNSSIRIFSFTLPFFAIVLTIVAVYQVFERVLLSVVVVVGQQALMILTVWFFASKDPSALWWAFPLSAAFSLLVIAIYARLHSRNLRPAVSPMLLVPFSEGGYTFDCSIPYNNTACVTDSLQEICALLERSGIDKSTVFKLRLACEELLMNIALHSKGHIIHHSFDVHVFAKDQKVTITIKDGGIPFNPIRAGKIATKVDAEENGKNLGLRIISNLNLDISYKYMYGLNIVAIKG